MSEEHKLEAEESQEPKSNTLKGILLSVMDYIINIVKLPFTVFAKFFTKEIIKALKKDLKKIIFLGVLLATLVFIISVMWLFAATAVGVYFYEKGNTVLISIGYSVLFQFLFFLLIGIILYINSKKLKSLKLIKSILNLEK